jgi:1,4-dihydroxy-6-naphthoate synthase
MAMRVKLAYSPCPNDTFMFHALINGLVDTEGIEFDVTLADVEVLNENSINNQYDVTKMSFHAFFYRKGLYSMLRCGSAFGIDGGPILVKRKDTLKIDYWKDKVVATPGAFTTGALLFYAENGVCKKFEHMIFSDVEKAVLSGIVDAGVLIHEGRFTYKEKGLELIRDFGADWKKRMKVPLPLGGIAVRKDLGIDFEAKMNRVLRRSIEYAIEHPGASIEYIAENAQEISEEVQHKHIDMFVNKYSLDWGENGEKAVSTLYGIFESVKDLYVKDALR